MKKQENKYWLIDSLSRQNTREKNQDYLGYKTNRYNDFIAIVCDGIGSLDKSEYASKIVVETFLESFSEDKKIKDVLKWFNKTLKDSFLKVQAFSDEHLYAENIGTTLVLALYLSGKVYVFNIGDSRAYLIVDHAVKQLSVDHNYYNALIKAGRQGDLKAERAKWGCITNYIDCHSFASADYDAMAFNYKPDDYLLLCTDGLYNFIDGETIVKILYSEIMTNDEKVDILIKHAMKNMSNDNISVILIKKR